MKVLVIVPAFNEEANILKTINKIKEVNDVDILIINDGSSDNTSILARSTADINVLDLPCNLGIGGAVQTGYKFADRNNYDIAIQIDGDGQHNPQFINQLLIELIEKNYDIVIGSRFIDKTGFQSTFARRIGIKYFYYLIRLLTGLKITDPTSGFRCCNKKAIKYFANYYPTDYPEPESIVFANRIGMKVTEVPVVMDSREGGVSSIHSYKSIYYMIKVTLAILIDNFRGRIVNVH